MRNPTLCALALLAAAAPPLGATLHVPADQPTIQAALDRAQLLGEEVIVAPGTYTGPGNTALDFKGKPTLLRSSGGAGVTIIDGEGISQGIQDPLGSAGRWTVRGFTFTNCRSLFSGYGGAIFCDTRGPVTIEECVFRANGPDPGIWGGTQGAAIYLVASAGFSVNVRDCVFDGNGTSGRGGAVYIGAGAVNLTRCRFENNSSDSRGGALAATGPASLVTIDESVFWNNTADFGGALYINSASLDVTRSTFVGNQANYASLLYDFDGITSAAAISFSHSIVTGGYGQETMLCGRNSTIAFSCTDFFGNEGGDWAGCLTGFAGQSGNFSADPAFCAPGSGMFTLAQDSPCAPPGRTGCGLLGALPVQCGPVSLDPRSWGRVKAGYRR